MSDLLATLAQPKAATCLDAHCAAFRACCAGLCKAPCESKLEKRWLGVEVGRGLSGSRGWVGKLEGSRVSRRVGRGVYVSLRGLEVSRWVHVGGCRGSR